MPEIVQMLIPVSNKVTRSGLKRKPRHITIHETGNEKKGANALSHARLQTRGNDRGASWHYQVDDGDTIYQSVPDDEVAWAAGDGRYGEGNLGGIQIEICVNSDGNFSKAVENAAWLVRYLLKKHNLTEEHVVQHNKWSGKNCPERIRSGKSVVTWGTFIGMVREKPIVTKPKEEIKLYKPSSTDIVNSTSVVMKRLEQKEGIPLDPKWRKQLLDGTLSESDAIGVLFVAIERGHIVGK